MGDDKKKTGDDKKECSSHSRVGGNLGYRTLLAPHVYALLDPRFHGDDKKGDEDDIERDGDDKKGDGDDKIYSIRLNETLFTML